MLTNPWVHLAEIRIANEDFVAQEVETYLKRMAEIHATGSATSETSYYGAFENLLNSIGKSLKPRVKVEMRVRVYFLGQSGYGCLRLVRNLSASRGTGHSGCAIGLESTTDLGFAVHR